MSIVFSEKVSKFLKKIERGAEKAEKWNKSEFQTVFFLAFLRKKQKKEK